MTLNTPKCLTAIVSLILYSHTLSANSGNGGLTWQQTESGLSQMAHGGVGLIQTPTARMANEGSMFVNYTDNDEYRFWSVSIQLYDWLESTVRYTDVRTRLYSDSPGFSGDQTLKDKGIDVKVRLLEESAYFPQVAVGFRDFGGTGFFESEFISLSKKWHDLDFHLGLGWGYLGKAGNIKNPFCSAADSFCQRPGGFGGQGGKIDYDQFFKGPASVFGGIEYQTPWRPLKLKLEYEGNDYKTDRAGVLPQDSRWNIGAVYQWGDARFDINYQRGNTFGFGVHYQLNLHEKNQYQIKPAKTPVTRPRQQRQLTTYESAMPSALFNDAGFMLRAYQTQGNEFIIYGNALYYRDDEEATERTARVVLPFAPAGTKTIRIVEYSGNFAVLEKVVNVNAFERVAAFDTLKPDVRSTYVRQSPEDDVLALVDLPEYSGFYTSAETFWVQSFGNPESFYMYQGGLYLGLGYQFSADLAFNTTTKLTVLENFDSFNFKVDSQNTPLPRVRTYVREYVTRSKVAMENAYLHLQKQPSTDWFVQAYAGYLETMYGGVGGEVLYRPVDSELAIGMDLNYVRQRSYENDFDFFEYKTLTGHLNLYWHPSFLPDTRLTFNIGQFLAKDKGVNVEFAKRFDSGIVLGAYAAITNVSSSEYGEGSFTKGFYISLPFDLFSTTPSKGRGLIPWVPIGRDGGQPLNRPVKLIDSTEPRTGFFN